MNWEAISAVGQIVGAAGVIISVIYLAQQVRSNARQTRLASMRSMSDAFNQWLQSLAENSEFWRLILSRYAGLRLDPRGGAAPLQRAYGSSLQELRRHV